MAEKLTPAMRRALDNIANGRVAGYGLRGMSAFGGLENTVLALHRRGLIAYGDDAIIATPAGIAALTGTPDHG